MKGALHRLLQGHQQVKEIQFSGKFRPFATPCAAMVFLFFFLSSWNGLESTMRSFHHKRFLHVFLSLHLLKIYVACPMCFSVHIAVRFLLVQVLVGAQTKCRLQAFIASSNDSSRAPYFRGVFLTSFAMYLCVFCD